MILFSYYCYRNRMQCFPLPYKFKRPFQNNLNSEAHQRWFRYMKTNYAQSQVLTQKCHCEFFAKLQTTVSYTPWKGILKKSKGIQISKQKIKNKIKLVGSYLINFKTGCHYFQSLSNFLSKCLSPNTIVLFLPEEKYTPHFPKSFIFEHGHGYFFKLHFPK